MTTQEKLDSMIIKLDEFLPKERNTAIDIASVRFWQSGDYRVGITRNAGLVDSGSYITLSIVKLFTGRPSIGTTSHYRLIDLDEAYEFLESCESWNDIIIRFEL